MKTVQTIQEVHQLVRQAHTAGKTIGFVPTMGALHAGHASLIDAARRECGYVVVSIFVNPIQFGPTEDLSRYPRTPQADEETCRSHGADLVFMPTAEEMYPPDERLTTVSVKELGRFLCGASRPGHFDGVCTVVAKLFNIVQPDKAYFGAKDFQQAAILKQMVTDLNFPIEMVVCPIVREKDGLAMSSRNAYLSAEHRKQAAALSGALKAAMEMIRRDHPAASKVAEEVREFIRRGAPAGFVDYVQVVDPHRLHPLESTNKPVLVALAVKFGATRLIDNILVD